MLELPCEPLSFLLLIDEKDNMTICVAYQTQNYLEPKFKSFKTHSGHDLNRTNGIDIACSM